MIFSENRCPLFRIMLQGKAIVPRPPALPAARGFPPRPRAFLLPRRLHEPTVRCPRSRDRRQRSCSAKASISMPRRCWRRCCWNAPLPKPSTTGRAVKPWPWADTWPQARITVKRIGASAIALAGSSGQALAFGPGHVERTADAGERGVAVYAAHRDTHFRFLRMLRSATRSTSRATMEKPSATAPTARQSCGSINRVLIRSRPATNSFSPLAGRSTRSRTGRCATCSMRR